VFAVVMVTSQVWNRLNHRLLVTPEEIRREMRWFKNHAAFDTSRFEEE
jgi:hypothetical protein